jgi:hypothetical protein
MYLRQIVHETLNLNNVEIEKVEETKLLGVSLDCKPGL